MPEALPQLIAVVGMVTLAGILLSLDFNNRANRAFALFLVIRALSMGATTVRDLANACAPATATIGCDVTMAHYLFRIVPYFFLAIPFVFVYFVSVYPRPRGPFGSRYGPWVLGGLALVVEFAYALDHSLWATYEILLSVKGAAYVWYSTYGLLFPFLGLLYLGYAVVALVLAQDYTREPPGPRRRSLLVVLLGFTVNALFDSSGTFLVFARNPGAATSNVIITALGLVPVLVALIILARFGLRTKDAEVRSGLVRFFVVLPLPVLSSLAGVLFTDWNNFNLLATGVWRLTMPALVTYALVRHQLFDIDVKVKLVLKESTVAAAFVAVFFAVSEGAQTYFSQNGAFIGIAAAGVLVFFLHPLQRLADRFADHAMPHAKPMAQMSQPERADLYREQARIAWEDGTMRRKERILLNALRERLSLTHEDAARIEAEVIPA